MEEIISMLGLDQAQSISGAIGSALSLRFYSSIGWTGRLTALLGGWASATFLAKPCIKWLKLIPPEDYLLGAGFLFGLFSMLITAAIWKVVAETQWVSAVTKRISGSTAPAAPTFEGDK